jgi:hypothetical protein
VWNGATWTQMFPGNNPSMRFYAMIDYDSLNAKVVMFGGGQGTQYGDIYLKDTWLWH